MNDLAILIDIGSTYTKVVAVDFRAAVLIGRGQAASTVNTDVREGLVEALARLEEQHRVFAEPPAGLRVMEDHLVLACSSAAGGLRMAVIGLVPGLTVEAASMAALGAGAKVVGSWSFKLAANATAEIQAERPDMILLTGGVDGGDSQTILHNARLLARSSLSVPVVVAGNQVVAGEVCDILTNSGKEARRVANVMPRPGELAVESAREEIRKLFIERITHAKGLDGISELVPFVEPTPMAVLQGAMLGAEGCEQEKGWGDLLVIDVGGATTDVHSIGYGQASGGNVIHRGVEEPFAKRTVEGDLGIRFNAATLLERVGIGNFERQFRTAFPQYTVSRTEFESYVRDISRETSRLGTRKWHTAMDAQLARVAVDFAVARHVGKKERIVTREGEAWLQSGKDLTQTRTVIGTGGVFVYNPHVCHILSQEPNDAARYEILRPRSPTIFVDSSYLLYAVGLLSRSHPRVAARIFRKGMEEMRVSPQRPGTATPQPK